jgi:predicted N-formylglutamate amidohydrolase
MRSPPHVLAKNTVASDWPEPIEVLNEMGSSPIVLICEHGSNHIPSEYAQLGLTADALREHIAWDIGAADLTRALSRRLDAVAFLGTYSRLLIDLNRPLGASTSIVAVSEAKQIPGNRSLSDKEARRRAGLIFTPFHNRIADFIAGRKGLNRPITLVSIHSFAPVFLGVARPFHVGVVFDKSLTLALRILSHIRTYGGIVAEANVPYQIHPEEDYAIPVYATAGDIPGVLIEIRNDCIADAKGVAAWTNHLVEALAGDNNGASIAPKN